MLRCLFQSKEYSANVTVKLIALKLTVELMNPISVMYREMNVMEQISEVVLAIHLIYWNWMHLDVVAIGESSYYYQRKKL